MSDLLFNLAARVITPEATVQPRVPSVFEPPVVTDYVEAFSRPEPEPAATPERAARRSETHPEARSAGERGPVSSPARVTEVAHPPPAEVPEPAPEKPAGPPAAALDRIVEVREAAPVSTRPAPAREPPEREASRLAAARQEPIPAPTLPVRGEAPAAPPPPAHPPVQPVRVQRVVVPPGERVAPSQPAVAPPETLFETPAGERLEQRAPAVAPPPGAPRPLGPSPAPVARPARVAGTPVREAPPAPAEPTIQVTIGRVEVRATPQPAPGTRPRPSPPVLGLEEYLRRRDRGGRHE